MFHVSKAAVARPMAATVSPMRLLRIPEPFDHPRFLFEPKLDGFHALAHIQGDACAARLEEWPSLHVVAGLAEEIGGADLKRCPEGRDLLPAPDRYPVL